MNGTGQVGPHPSSASPHDRNRPLHILFVHSGSLEVQRCLRELDHAHARVMADLVSTPNQFAERLSSKSYDAVLAELLCPTGMALRHSRCCAKRTHKLLSSSLADAIPQETVTELSPKELPIVSRCGTSAPARCASPGAARKQPA